MSHIPVLLNEVIETLDIQNGQCVVDGTVNGGGHAVEILKRLNNTGEFIGCDVDKSALTRCANTLKEAFKKTPINVSLTHQSFENFAEMTDKKIDRVLLDLGWSMNQFADSARGFSFMIDGPLDMRLAYPPQKGSTRAADIINTSQEYELFDIIKVFGEDKNARKIARAIVTQRKKHPIQTTRELAQCIQRIIPKRGKTHPATQTFQALRIATNHELLAITEAIPDFVKKLNPGGIIAVITFHSVEDRIVKQLFGRLEKEGLGKQGKHIKPSRKEILANPRSRSALLRYFHKL